MALSVRAASGGQNGSTLVASQAVTFPTGTTTNDLVYVIISVNATVTSPTATGWNPQVISNATTTHSLIICYRTILAGDTAPTITWTGSAKASWTAVTLQPAAGQQAAHSGFGTAVNTGTAATSHTPPNFAAGGASGASVLLNAFRTGANGATGVTTTAPTNWTEPTNGDQTTAVTSTQRQVAAEVSVRAGQTGTITPGSETITVSSSAILQHAFAVEQVAPPSVDAGADASVLQNATFSRTASETLNGGTVTSRDWSIVAGPTGVGSSIGSAAALSWTPSDLGQYTLRYTLVASNGTVTDDVLVTVGYLRSEVSGFNTTTAPITLTLPASTVGDKVVLLQATDYYTMAALGTPTGTAVTTWTELTLAQFDGGTFTGDGTPRVHFKAWMGTVTTGGASTVIANWASPSGGDEERYAHALVFTSTALYDTATSAAQSASTTWTVPSVTAAEDNSYQLIMVANSTVGGFTNFTFPAGMTTQAEVDSFITFRSGWGFVPTAGAIGTRSITSSASVSGGIQTVVIKPTVVAAGGSLPPSRRPHLGLIMR